MAACKTQHLIRRDAGQVSLCECGTVAVTVGSVTLRLARAEFDKFAALVREAATHFDTAFPSGAAAADVSKHELH